MGLRFYCHRTLRYTSANLILQQNVDKISIIGIGKIVKEGIYPVLPVSEQERKLGVKSTSPSSERSYTSRLLHQFL